MNFDLINTFQKAKKAITTAHKIITEMEQEEVVGISKNAEIKVYMNCAFKYSKVEVSEDFINGDKSLLEDSLLDAVKDLVKKAIVERSKVMDIKEMTFSSLMVESEMIEDLKNLEHNVVDYQNNIEKFMEMQASTSSSNELVKVFFNYHGIVNKVEISPTFVNPEAPDSVTKEEIDSVQNVITEAFIDVQQKAFEVIKTKSEEF